MFEADHGAGYSAAAHYACGKEHFVDNELQDGEVVTLGDEEQQAAEW